MKTCFRIFLMELRKLLTYRADFWINFFGLTFFALVIAYFLWDAIFDAANETMIRGQTLTSIIFYYLVAPLVFRVQQGQNIGFLSRDIYEGSLSKYLLYPLSINSFKLATYLANSFFFFIQLCCLIVIYQIIFFNNDVFTFDALNFFLFIFVVSINCISYFYLFSMIELTAFWFDNVWSLGVMLRFICGFLGGAIIPLVFFPKWAQTILDFTPFPYMIDFPYQVLQGQESISGFIVKLVITLLWLLIFRMLSLYVWKRGKFKYSGVGI